MTNEASTESDEQAGTPEALESLEPNESLQAAADTVYYPLAPGYQVNVRSGPSTGHQIVRVLSQNTRVPIRCQMRGETVSGPCGTTDIWDNIAPGQYVSDSYVKTGSSGFVTIPCA